MLNKAKMLAVWAMVAAVSSAAMAGNTVANFDDLTLATDSYWNGAQNWIDDGSPVPGQSGVPSTPNPIVYNDSFDSGNLMSFGNQFSSGWSDDWGGYGWTAWNGWAYSNRIDNTIGGFANQFDVMAGAAHSGSNFAVAYPGFSTPATVTLASATTLGTTQLTLTSWSYYSLRDGDLFASALAAGDWFKVTVTGKNAGASTGSFDVFLADYRDGKTFLCDAWTEVDLSTLGAVDTVEFAVSASDGGTGWPSYFAMDTMVPEPATMGLLAFGGLSLLIRRRKTA